LILSCIFRPRMYSGYYF